jgi:hypothetical protein
MFIRAAVERGVGRRHERTGALVENGPDDSPRGEYRRRLEERRRREAALTIRERLIGLARVAVFLVGLSLLWPVFGLRLFPTWQLAGLALAAPIALFSGLLIWHERVTRAWRRARQAAAFYHEGLARLDGTWRGRGRSGERFRNEKHPYAADLDLFGAGSLFELLCTARTRTGEDALASWLLAPASAQDVRARQDAVAELRPQLDFREDLALLGADVPAGVEFDRVAAWGGAPPSLTARWQRWAALVLGVFTTASFFGWLFAFFGLLPDETWLGAIFNRVGSVPFVVLGSIEGALALALAGRVGAVLRDVENRSRDLALLSKVLARLEEAPVSSPRLRALQATLAVDGAPPSRRIAQLSNLIEVLNSRRNQLFAPFAYLLMWGTQSAFAVEAWRAGSGLFIRTWLAAVGEFEALCAFASYGFENPSDPFPEVVADGACYDGEGLRHPLLPDCVPNDLRLGGDLRVLIVSGSNMSGKSTFLRTVGVNAVLALAGAPVRARRLRLSPLALGATLRIQDSLQEGKSRFYAEILRVRQVVDLSRGPTPLLFLLDEIFAGTNSHDRRLGAESVVSGLVAAGALGLVTTHDLSLTRIADRLDPKAANVHFADHFENGEMTFDYRLHPGVVRHSNALALMRAVGLRV